MARDTGRVCRPARRIELPWTYTKNWEKKNDEPMSANPTTTMAVLDTVNRRCPNSRSGSIGAERRASTVTKAARRITAAAKPPRMTGEVQPRAPPSISP